MKVAIVGSRDFRPLDRVEDFVMRLAEKYPDSIVISGGARGVDSIAERVAEHVGLEVLSFRPYKFDSIYDKPLWSIETLNVGERANQIAIDAHRRINTPCFPSFGRAAFARNEWIVQSAEQVVAFWANRSRGTAHSIECARKLGIPVHIYEGT